LSALASLFVGLRALLQLFLSWQLRGTLMCLLLG
jgi:hypothetical protein